MMDIIEVPLKNEGFHAKKGNIPHFRSKHTTSTNHEELKLNEVLVLVTVSK